MKKHILIVISIFFCQSLNTRAYGEYVSCQQKEYSTIENCNVLLVSKKIEQPFKSYLGKKYTGYTYKIKNGSSHKVSIESFQHVDYPASTIKHIQDERIRFPKSFHYFAYIPVLLALPAFPPGVFILGASGHPYIALTSPVSAPIVVVWSAIASPYYGITDKKKDEKAFSDTEKYLQKFSLQTISPNEEFQFTALLSSFYIVIFYKVDNLDNVYTITK